MNTLLWILQVALFFKFISVAFTHGFRRNQTEMQQGIERLGGAAHPLLTIIAICTFLGGIGLVLPAATWILTWLTPLSAAFLALTMLPAVGFHLSCRENPKIWASLVIFVLAAFVAYGRWVIAPI